MSAAAPIPVRLQVRIGITAGMALLTLAGSAANLWHIADKAQMVPYLGALSLVAALDGLALVAALTVHDDRRNPWGWLALVVGTLGSAGLQYAVSVPIDGEIRLPLPGGYVLELLRALHALPTLATLVTAHLTITALPAGAETSGEAAAEATGTDATGITSVATSVAPIAPETAHEHAVPAAPLVAGPSATDSSSARPRRAALDTGGGPGDRDSVVVVPPADTPVKRELDDKTAVHELTAWLEGQDPSTRRLLKGATELGFKLGSSRADRIAPTIRALQMAHPEGLPHGPRPPLVAVPDRHASA
jgi:hypothetical protein